jgi:hypothetical protein
MKKPFYIFTFFIFFIFFSSCQNGDNEDKDNNDDNKDELNIKTNEITFLNVSSYIVIIHLDSFSGPVLEKLNNTTEREKTIPVRTSDNFGNGTTFSFEYLYPINDGSDLYSGEVCASGIDPDMQFTLVIEENKSYPTIQITNPKNLEFKSAFIKIQNGHNMQLELRHFSDTYKQAGNGHIPVAPEKFGIYKFDNIPDEGELIQNYKVVSTLPGTPIPDFTMMNGIIYDFYYNGFEVIKTGEQTILFK